MSSFGPWPTIDLGVISFNSHSLFFGLGAILAALILYQNLPQNWLKKRNLDLTILLLFISGLLGARLGYLITYPSSFQSWEDIFQIWEGGMLSYTGILGSVGFGLFWLKAELSHIKKFFFDQLALAVLPAWAVGRIGNFLVGDSHGIVSSVWWFSYNRVPLPLLESIGCLIIYLILKRYQKKSEYIVGKVFYYGVQSYLILRVIVDIWRDEGVFYIHYSQWAAIILFIIYFGVNKWSSGFTTSE